MSAEKASRERKDRPEDFFGDAHSMSVRLTRDAALKVCQSAADHNLLVMRIEPGKWHFPGFQPSMNEIWDGLDPPVSRDVMVENNKNAEIHIGSRDIKYDVFLILTDKYDVLG